MAKQQYRAGRHPDYEATPAAVPAGNTYFLGIGIDAYAHWPRLQNAVRDVRAIADLLVSDYGLEQANTYLLFNEAATETRIVETMEELTHKVQPTDSLLIYYAGHGHLNDRGRGFWVPVDAPRGQVVRYIRNSTIKDYIGDIPSLHTLLISDSCFSGSLFSSGATRGSDLAAEELARLPSRWAICSGRHDEVVADGPGDGHSPFAESILEVLSGSLRPLITTGFLVQQVIEQTRANYDQLPDGGPLQGVGHKRGQFVFRQQKGKGASRLWDRIQEAPEDTIVAVDEKKNLIRQYCQDYPKGENYQAALEVGRRLEYKRQFLEAFDSEFGLLALLEQNTPYVEEIQARLRMLRQQQLPRVSKTEPLQEPKVTATPISSSAAASAEPPFPASSPQQSWLQGATRRFWIYAGVLLLLSVIMIMARPAIYGYVNGMYWIAVYALLVPGLIIWRYHQQAADWRNTWRLGGIALVGLLLFYFWRNSAMLVFPSYVLKALLIGALPLVPTWLMALTKGQKVSFPVLPGKQQSATATGTGASVAPASAGSDGFGAYALACIITTAIPAYVLLLKKLERLDPVVGFLLLVMLFIGPMVLIWRYGRKSLAPWKSLALGFLTIGTFIGFGLAIEGDTINPLEALAYMLLGFVYPIPAWIGIWLKKRQIRS